MEKPIIIVSDGKMTMVFSDGKVYGDHVSEISFLHKAGDKPFVRIAADEIPIRSMSTDTERFQEFIKMLMEKEKYPQT